MTEGPEAAEGAPLAAAAVPDPGQVGAGAPDDEGQARPTYEELEAQLGLANQRALNYEFLYDVANNRVILQRTAGPTVYQESWDPEFTQRVIDSLGDLLGKLKAERSQYLAHVRRIAEDQGPGGPKLWTPGQGPLPGGPPMPNRAQRRAAART